MNGGKNIFSLRLHMSVTREAYEEKNFTFQEGKSCTGRHRFAGWASKNFHYLST